MSKELLLLDATRKLHGNYYTASILGLIEQKYISEALAEAQNTGLSLNADDILQRANASVPQGPVLVNEYEYTKDALNAIPLRLIEELYDQVRLTAVRLAHLGNRSLIAGAVDAATESHIRQMEQNIDGVYSQVIEAANEFEATRQMTPQRHNKVEKILAEPAGPLQPFFKNASAAVDASETEQKVYAHQR